MTKKTKKTKPTIDWRVIIVGILALTVIECVAMANGFNGTVRSIIIAIIAIAIGINIPNPLNKS